MNSLQIGLIGIGVLVVAILFAWQWWQGRRASDTVNKPGASVGSERDTSSATGAQRHDLPDMRDVRGGHDLHDFDDASGVSEPRGKDSRPRPVEPVVASASVRTEPSLDAAISAAWEPRFGEVELPSGPRVAVDPIDASIGREPVAALAPTALPEAVSVTPPLGASASAPVSTPAPAGGAPSASSPAAAPVAAPDRHKLVSEWPFDERLHVHASIVSLSGGAFDAAPFVATAGRASAWVRLFRQSPWEAFDPSHVGSVQHLVLALPLASRAGPIETHDIDAWRFLLTEQATQLGCEAHFHGFRDGPVRAAELDSFLAAVDIIPVVYVVKKDGGDWAGTRLRSTLEANGFRLQSDGRFAYHEIESDAVIFYAVDGFERPFTPERLRTESITALRCTLEPARLLHPMARFDMFRQSLRALSKLLDAELKTSEGEALGEAQFATMCAEVRTAMDALSSAGIAPGSETARALFS